MQPKKKTAIVAFERLPDPVFEPDPAITRVDMIFKTHVDVGFTEAFCFSFTSDNHGPQTLEQVQAAFAILRLRFPKAKITTYSFNELAAVSFNLCNNTWTTNFPMWNGEDVQFWFKVWDSTKM
jgi:hypothetical protein